jgi:AraC-like DNA-binding protein
MNFHIKLYRAPHLNNQLIVIGHAEIEAKALEQLLPAADPLLYESLKEHLDQLSNDGSGQSLLTSVRVAVAESMKDGKPDLTRVAKRLEVGPRTLQRRLNAYGIDFKQLIDDFRCRLALTYLKDTKTRLTEIALLLGYSEASAFNHAFKRWTGCSPLEFRRAIARSRVKKV